MDLKYQFNSYLYMSELASLFGDILKDDLGKLILPDGTVTDQPAIYIADQQIPDANLPRIVINYIFDRPAGSDRASSGLEELTDPSTGNKITVPYYETYIKWQVMLDCLSSATSTSIDAEGNFVNTPTANNILTKLRKNLLIPRHRQYINDNIKSTLQPFTTTDLRDSENTVFQTQVMKASTLLITFDTRDRVYDFDGGWFNAIEYEGLLNRQTTDPDPLKVDRTVYLEKD